MDLISLLASSHHLIGSDFARTLAYIDPGSGSFAIQIIVASALAAAYTVKTFWRNIKERVFGRKPKDESKPDVPS